MDSNINKFATWKNLTDICSRSKFDENVTERSFSQGFLGNCGMIAAMATLAANPVLFNKVVGSNKNFENVLLRATEKPLRFVFNLYKNGKSYKVVVDEKLPYIPFWNKLFYSNSPKNNFLGPLLEKALIHLHFNGKYKSAKGVPAFMILSSFTNSFFEEFRGFSDEIYDVINHGIKTKSLIVVIFKENVQKFKYALLKNHYYTYKTQLFYEQLKTY